MPSTNQNGLSQPSHEVMAAKETQMKAAPRMGLAVEPPEASEKTIDSYLPWM